MGNSLPGPVLDQIANGRVQVTALVEFQFKTETIRLWHGYGDLRAMGYTWRGDMGIGSISPIGVSPAGIAEEMRFRIAATDEVMILADQDADNDETVFRPVRVWAQFFDDRPGQQWQLVGDPLLFFDGTMGGPELVTEEPGDDGVHLSYIEVTATNMLAVYARPALRYFSKEDQRAASSDGEDQICDRIGEFLSGSVTWPRF